MWTGFGEIGERKKNLGVTAVCVRLGKTVVKKDVQGACLL